MKALQRRCQDEILHDCAYVQHEIDRVRAEKRLGDERGSSGEDATTQWGVSMGVPPIAGRFIREKSMKMDDASHV